MKGRESPSPEADAVSRARRDRTYLTWLAQLAPLPIGARPLIVRATATQLWRRCQIGVVSPWMTDAATALKRCAFRSELSVTSDPRLRVTTLLLE